MATKEEKTVESITCDRGAFRPSKHLSPEDILDVCQKMGIPVPEPGTYIPAPCDNDSCDICTSRADSDTGSDSDTDTDSSDSDTDTDTDSSDSDNESSESDSVKSGPCGENINCIIL